MPGMGARCKSREGDCQHGFDLSYVSLCDLYAFYDISCMHFGPKYDKQFEKGYTIEIGWKTSIEKEIET